VYLPHFNAVADEVELRRIVAAAATAQLITVGPDGYPRATLLPVLWHGERVIAHMARANEHWRVIEPGSPALLVCTGPDAYVSPSWYASKAEHGKVVPTWNYSMVQLTGRASVHDDPAWVREAVTTLTETHESGRAHPWAVSDAPDAYVAGQMRAIVGIEFCVERVEGKAKLSQNRSDADRTGVIEGLRADGTAFERAVADDMERELRGQPAASISASERPVSTDSGSSSTRE
jgi:transcriptional regulator